MLALGIRGTQTLLATFHLAENVSKKQYIINIQTSSCDYVKKLNNENTKQVILISMLTDFGVVPITLSNFIQEKCVKI